MNTDKMRTDSIKEKFKIEMATLEDANLRMNIFISQMFDRANAASILIKKLRDENTRLNEDLLSTSSKLSQATKERNELAKTVRKLTKNETHADREGL